jgi:hypothetical protein
VSSASPRTCAVAPLLWAALGLALTHLALVLVGSSSPLLLYLRAILSCLVLPIAGLPAALLLLAGRGKVNEGGGEIGGFSLAAIALGCGLLSLYLVAVIARLARPPLTATTLSLFVVGASAVGLLLAGRFDHLRVRPEPGLTGPPLALALLVAVAFAVVSPHRLFGGLTRLVILPAEARQRLLETGTDDPRRFELRLVSGARRLGFRRYRPTRDAVLFRLENRLGRVAVTRLTLVYTGPIGSTADLFAVPCPGARRGARLQLGRATVPEEVLTSPLATVAPRFNALLLGYADLEPGPSCFEVRVNPPHHVDAGVELTDISHERLGQADVAGGRFSVVGEGAAECHVTDARFAVEKRWRSTIHPGVVITGYFTQLAAETLAGQRDPMLGVLFLMLSLYCFAAALVIIGRAGAAGDRAARRAAGLLLLGPFVNHLHALIHARSLSFAFPDATYSALALAALSLLLLRERVGFVVVGCEAALARNPGALILGLALLSRLALFKDDRRWTRGTLAWSAAAGLGVAAVLLVYFAATTGVGEWLRALYFEVVPEHFQIHRVPLPAWQRIPIFLAKLALLSSLTPLLWPLCRGAGSRLMVIVTLGYAAALMGVHVPHSHYFPILSYGAAAAGLGGLAGLSPSDRQRRLLLWIAVAVVAVGTWLGLSVGWLVR